MAENKFAVGINSQDATEEEVALDIIDRFERAQRQLETVKSAHSRWLEQYYGIIPPLPAAKKDMGASNLFIPLVEPRVDTVVARMFLTALSADPVIRFEAASQDGVLAARITERILNYYITKAIPDSYDQLWNWFFQATLLGQGYVHIYHDRITHSRMVVENATILGKVFVNPFTGKPVLTKRMEEVVDYDGYRFETIDISNLAADWNVEDFKKSWAIVREYIEPETYLERVKSAGYTAVSDEEIESMLVVPGSSQPGTVSLNNKPYHTESNKPEQRGPDNREKIELFHYYGKGYFEGKRVDVTTVVCRNLEKRGDKKVGSGKTVLPVQPFSVKPIARMRFKPGTEDFIGLGRGLGAQLEGLQAELITTRNQRIDNIAFELNGGWIYTDGAIEDENALNSRAGQKIKITDPTGIVKKIERQPLPSDSFIHEKSIQEDADRVSGSADIMRGAMGRKETATTATLLNNNAGQRLEAIAVRALNEGLRDLGRVMQTLLVENVLPEDRVTIKLAEGEVEKYASIFQDTAEISPDNYVTIVVRNIDKAMTAVPSIGVLVGDERSRGQILIQFIQTMYPLLANGWRKKDGSVETMDLSYAIKEYLRTNKIDDFRGVFVTLETAAQALQKQQLAMVQQAAEASSKIPEEPGGMALLQPPQEAQAQQDGVEEALLNEQ